VTTASGPRGIAKVEYTRYPVRSAWGTTCWELRRRGNRVGGLEWRWRIRWCGALKQVLHVEVGRAGLWLVVGKFREIQFVPHPECRHQNQRPPRKGITRGIVCGSLFIEFRQSIVSILPNCAIVASDSCYDSQLHWWLGWQLNLVGIHVADARLHRGLIPSLPRNISITVSSDILWYSLIYTYCRRHPFFLSGLAFPYPSLKPLLLWLKTVKLEW